jgi:hypothetical protein
MKSNDQTNILVMKTFFNTIIFKVLLLTFFISQAGCQPSDYEKTGDSTTYYYAVEMGGTLCGFAEVTETPVTRDGARLTMQENDTRISMNLMGKGIETRIQFLLFLDSTSLRPVYSEVKVDQGNIHVRYESTVQDNMAQLYNVKDNRSSTVELSDSTIIDNIIYFPYLVRDFNGTGLMKKTYQILDEREQKVIEKEFTFEGMDTLFLAGKEYVCMNFSEVNLNNGMLARSWIDPVTGMWLRNDITGIGRNIYLSDYRVKQMVSTYTVDDLLFYNVGEVIPGFKKMTYMKVRVEINSIGDILTSESLNSPGQVFEGVVEGNLVSGTFELEPVRYNGQMAPSFPYDRDLPEDMKKYLEPEDLIESNDIEIAHFAKQVTKDAGDSWDAAVSLSRWVSDNISGAIPGGGSAKGTLEMRQAECGGHSRLLTAMCRAVGIPARLAIGGMYVPDNGGFFGQHAWTEVYMGEAGWIPVDATIEEVDYIDAGHIRLGEKSTFHPKMMEIVEYRLD